MSWRPLRRALRAALPATARRRLREIPANRRRRGSWPQFAAAVAELRTVAPADPPLPLLERLRSHWGDPDSAPAGLMLAALREFREREHDGVECGSGLSTVVMGVYAEALGRRWCSLDQDAIWARRVRGATERLGLTSVTVLDAALRRYEGFEWYAIADADPLPQTIDFVLCDGPPADHEAIRTRRYGLVPVLGDRFTADVAILLDDVSRPGEQEVLTRWRAAGFEWSPGEASREFAVVTRSPAG